MILVSVAYPTGLRFDLDYYRQTHMPLVQSRWAALGLTEARVFRGTGAPGGGAPSFQILALLTFRSQEDFERAVGQHGAEVMGDIKNFCDGSPIIQINEPVM